MSQLYSRIKTVTLILGLFLIDTLGLSCLSITFFKQQDLTLAQQYIPTIKHRNLVIDLGNRVKTKVQRVMKWICSYCHSIMDKTNITEFIK